ncbi:glycosyl hydrolase 115 family protein [Cohnella fermenti]
MSLNGARFAVTRDTGYDCRVEATPAIRHVWDMIVRDHEAVFGQAPHTEEPYATSGTAVARGSLVVARRSPTIALSNSTAARGSSTVIVRAAEPADRCPEWPEAFVLRFCPSSQGMCLHIAARDELGLLYGMLRYSREVLGVDPFWFWADRPPERRERIEVPAADFDSVRPKVRYRGWFVNDEVCLIGWKEEYPPTREVWEPVFEALLRCGGNMVIPGTDLPKTGVHAELAAEMGLYLTHHHAEPLGAEMFLRAYPGKNASYKEFPELFERLWREAIDKQKNDCVLWVLSFRGQGDKPFWENDPAFDTPESRGAMISHVVRRQHDMIREQAAEPVCCMAMYGEIAELYKAGHIEVPDGVIKIWADNGYGKMVSRRHGNLNERVPALPPRGDRGRNGVYYHVTFHDLQASNHLTLFPSPPELIAGELEAAFEAGASEYVLVNCGNIRPHLYTLDLVAELWHESRADVGEHLNRYARRMFAEDGRRDGGEEEPEAIAELFRGYFDSAIAYGPHPDDRAGDEFYHHPAREIVGHWLRGQSTTPNAKLLWAAGDRPFREQVRRFANLAQEAIASWEALERRIVSAAERLPAAASARLQDQLLLPVRLHLSGCRGLAALGRAFEAYADSRYALAFVHASEALGHYGDGQQALREAEHGRWANFYRADWLTNIANTVDHMDTLRRWLRMHGDSPDMFLWYKEYLMPETEKHIYLENTHRNPLSDDKLAAALGERFRQEEPNLFVGY